MEPITIAFVADNLERAGRVLGDMQALLESDVDRHSLCDVLAWALHSVQREIFDAVEVLREQSASGGDGSPPEQPAGKTIADMVTPERLAELRREFEQAAAMGEQVLKDYLNRHQQ